MPENPLPVLKLTIYIDGACRFNPGPAGAGVWIVDGLGRTLAEISQPLGPATNNIAEWSAYLRALKEAKRLGAKDVSIFSDSKLLVEQVAGRYRVRDPKLRLLWEEARGLAGTIPKIKLSYVPRANNSTADRLAKKASRERFPGRSPVPRIL